MDSTTQWWKRLRCDCFADDIVRDDQEDFTELLIPNKNDVSHVTDSTAGESEVVWDEDDGDILVHDPITNYPLPPQHHDGSYWMDMLAPTVAGKGVMDLVDMAKTKFMSSSEINYPPSQTGSSLVDYSKVDMPTASASWAKVAANLRARRNKTARANSNHSSSRSMIRRKDASEPASGNTLPRGPYLLGITFPHPAYMTGHKDKNSTATTPPPHNKQKYFKTSSNVHHPTEEHVRISKEDKVVVRL